MPVLRNERSNDPVWNLQPFLPFLVRPGENNEKWTACSVFGVLKGHLCGTRPSPPVSMNLGGSLRSVSSNGGAEATATCPKEVAGEKEILELDRADE